jgi:Skp family chaperone for outer membrane proteins
MMMRRSLIAANILALLGLATVMVALIGFGGMPLPVGAAAPQPPAAASPSKVGVFNMAMLMKHYGKAKYEVYQINEEKKRLSVDIVSKREKLIKLGALQKKQLPATKEELAEEQRELARELEDMERNVNRVLNDKAAIVIKALYDEIKEVVDKLAETKGYDLVFAYPDATTPDELNSTYVKELKLKPPAAQPFFVAKNVDLTDEIIKELNTRHPAPPVPDGAQPPMPGK